MKSKLLLAKIEEYQKKLIEHQALWGASLDRTMPEYATSNHKELDEQARWLSRATGALKPYLERFSDRWTMKHPATGIRWNVLETAVGLQSIAQMKGPSLAGLIERLDQIIGRLQMVDPDEEIPEEPTKPIRSGATADRLMSGYLDHLHPYIHKGCAKLFSDGHYSQAIEECAKAVLQYIRDVTGLRSDGSDLVSAAFSTTNPLLAFGDLTDENIRNEQVGFMNMVKGLAQGVRNPFAHTHGRQEEMVKAFEYLVMASLFCRRIDDARPEI